MSFSWQYPLYLIPHGMGYVSIVDPEWTAPEIDAANAPEAQDASKGQDMERDMQPRQLLVVLTDEDRAAEFMRDFQLTGAPRRLDNAREFSWLLRALKHPVTQVAFDPQPRERQVNSRITLGVRELLEDYLVVDYSPWNYPVYAIAQQHGFASILQEASDLQEGDGSSGERPAADDAGHGAGGGDRQARTAVILFSDSERAEAYLEAVGQEGTLCELTDVDLTRRFLEALADQVSAVALNARVEEGRISARHAFPITILLEKYLVHEQ